MNKQLWNLLQRGRGVLQLQPLGCLSDCSSSFCLGCEPNQYYECEVCGYLQPYCKGADDDYFEICDDCWGIAGQMPGATGIPMEAIMDDERRYRGVASWHYGSSSTDFGFYFKGRMGYNPCSA